MAHISSFAGVARAPFLLLPVTLVINGAAAAYYDGSFLLERAILALVGLIGLHMAVNIFNEWSDYRSGIDLNTERTPFSGGSGTLPSGALSAKAALVFGIVCSLIGLGIGVYFLLLLGRVMVVFLIVGAMCVLFYTTVLARIGTGEIAAGLGLGALPVIGTALVQSGAVSPTAVAASIGPFFMTFNLLLLNEFPDEAADREGRRRNLVLLLGRKPAAFIWVVAALSTPISIVVAWYLGHLPIFCLAAMAPSALLVGPMRWALGRSDEAVPIPALGANVIWNLATNVMLGIALVVSTL
jgi:1,4-dihydroxy-2-naphthoate octaprenyltransferase